MTEEYFDFKKTNIEVFSSHQISYFISFYRITKLKGSLYPFAILNSDRSSKPGTHWLSILDIHSSKELFLFESYAFTDFKAILTHKILCRTNKFNKKDDVVTFISLKISVDAYLN